MKFFATQIIEKKQILDDTFVFRVSPKPFNFLAGQYVFLQNPDFKPEEPHPFSISSSPLQQKYLEFCIKIYGQWTQKFSHKEVGEKIYISHPHGNFTWDSSISNAVFLLGGIGISPIMSMLRTLENKQPKPTLLTMLYGNRTPNTIAYQKELEELQTNLPLKIIHIFSHILADDPWSGYRGFITREIIEKESKVENKPTFFIVGPPIFIDKMKEILEQLQISPMRIKQELLVALIPQSKEQKT